MVDHAEMSRFKNKAVLRSFKVSLSSCKQLEPRTGTHGWAGQHSPEGQSTQVGTCPSQWVVRVNLTFWWHLG